MKLYRVRRPADRGVWDTFLSPATLGAITVLALAPLIVPALLLWGGFVLVLRAFDQDRKSK